MDGSIRLRADERKRALHVLRRGSDPELRLRAHILLLLDARRLQPELVQFVPGLFIGETSDNLEHGVPQIRRERFWI